MAEQVINGAIEHVLANRHSSFRELVTNAVDACKEGPPIGQFGMGFFSTLTYLDGGQITVETRTDDQAYKMTLFKLKDRIFVQFDRIEEGETGTTVTIEGSFSDKDIAKIQKDLQRLKIVHGAQIAINGKSFGEGPLVAVTLDNDRLQVQDWGTGIPLKTACTALLVPSSSSKRQVPSGEASCELKQYRENASAGARFLVGVNGAVIIDLPLDGSHTQDLLVRLPNNTPLTLDRKSVQFAGPHDQTIRALKQLIKQAVAEAVDKPERLALLHEGLTAWEASAALPLSLSYFLQEEFDASFQNSGLTPYPLSHEKQLRPILKSLGIEKTFPASPRLLRYDYRPAVALITETANARKDLVNLPVVFQPDEQITGVSDCGLHGCLFVPSSALREAANDRELAFYVATRYSEYGRRIALHPSLKPKGKRTTQGPGLFFASARKPPESTFHEQITLQQAITLAKHPAFSYLTDEVLSQFFQRYENWIPQVMKFAGFVHQTLCDQKLFEKEILPKRTKHNNDKVYRFRDGSYCRVLWETGEPELVAMSPPEVLRAFLARTLSNNGLLSENQLRDFASDIPPATLFRDERPIWPFTEVVKVDQIEMILAACFLIHDSWLPPPPESLARLRSPNQVGLFYLGEGESPTPRLLEASSQLISFQETAAFLANDSLRARSMELMQIVHLTQQHLSGPLQVARLERMSALIFGLFRNYLSIPDHEFPQIYGKRSTRGRVQPSYNLGPCKGIAEVLALFGEDSARFEKLVRFAEMEYEAVLSPAVRKRSFENNKRLILPTISQFGVLSSLYNLTHCIHASHLVQLVDCANTPEQLVAGCSLLLGQYLKKDSPELHPQPGTPGHARISRAIEAAMVVGIPRIPNLKEKVRNFLTNSQGLSGTKMALGLQTEYYTDFKPIDKLITEHLKQDIQVPQRAKLLDPAQDQVLNESRPFTAKQLFNAQDQRLRSALQEGDLDGARTQIASASRDTELQIYHHAIEAGSARAIEEAFFLEALQNSIDAAKGNADAQIKFEAALQGDHHVTLSVSDTVGFSGLDILLGAFLIPNQSPKRGSDSVGQMGNGSFQVYRKAERVIVKTRCHDRVALLSIRPMRVDGKVTDLSLRCIIVDEPDFQGTRIDVKLLSQEPTEAKLQALRAASFVREVISTTNTPVQLTVREEPLAGIDRDHVVTGLSEPASRFIKLKRPSQRGQLLTGGLPAGDLATFLVTQGIATKETAEDFSRGWCLELPTKGYRPVQSRSEVQLQPGRSRELKTLFADWLLYRATFDPATYESAFRSIPHAESDVADFHQVKPLEYHLLLDHNASFLKAPLRKMIFDAYDTLVADLGQLEHQYKTKPVKDWEAVQKAFSEEVGSRFDSWKREQIKLYGTNPMAQRFVERVLVRWFEPKVAAFAQTALPSLESLKAANPTLRTQEEQLAHKAACDAVSTSLGTAPVNPRQGLEWGRRGIELYCNAIAKFNEMAPLKANFEFDPDRLRSASHRNGCITVNLAHNPLSQILSSFSQLARGIPLDDSTDPAGLFLIRPGDAGTLNHELEHARRHEQCISGGVHDPSTDAEGTKASFEACAASFARRAHRLGAFEGVRDGMRDLIGEYKTEELEELVSALRTLETNHPRELQEWLAEKFK